MRDYWISKAIRICGSQKELARRMRIKPDKVSYMLNEAKRISLQDALLIEDVTDGEVTCFHLIEYLDPRIKRKLVAKADEAKELRISECVALAMVYENELGDRKGQRSDLRLCENFPNVKGRTQEIAAHRVGLKNYKTYQQAKRVIQLGIPELVHAMDSKQISISLAAKLAALQAEEQRKVLQHSHSKKEVINKLNQMLQINEQLNSPLKQADLDAFLLNSLQIYLYLSHYLERMN